MDASEELREELNRRRDAAAADARAKEQTADDRARYEQEVEDVRARLYKAVELAIEALEKSEPPTSVEVAPKPSGLAGLLQRPTYVEGWQVRWGRDEAVICPDWTLVIFNWQGYQGTNFTEIIDKRLADVGAHSGDDSPGAFQRAFVLGNGDRGAAGSLRSELDRARHEIIRDISAFLLERKLSI